MHCLMKLLDTSKRRSHLRRRKHGLTTSVVGDFSYHLWQPLWLREQRNHDEGICFRRLYKNFGLFVSFSAQKVVTIGAIDIGVIERNVWLMSDLILKCEYILSLLHDYSALPSLCGSGRQKEWCMFCVCDIATNNTSFSSPAPSRGNWKCKVLSSCGFF